MGRANSHVTYPWEASQDLRMVVKCLAHEGEVADQRDDEDAALMLDGAVGSAHNLEITLYPKNQESVAHVLRRPLPPDAKHGVSVLLLSESSRRTRHTAMKIGSGGYAGILDLSPREFRGQGTLTAKVYLESLSKDIESVGKASAPKSLLAWVPPMAVTFDASPWRGSGLETEWVNFSESTDMDLKRHDKAYFAIREKEGEDGVSVLYLNEGSKLGPAFRPVLATKSTNDAKRRLRDLVFHEIAVVGWVSLLASAAVELGRLMASGQIDLDHFTWEEAREGLAGMGAQVLQDWAPHLCPSEAEPHKALCIALADPLSWSEFILNRIPLAVQHRQGSRDFTSAAEYLELP